MSTPSQETRERLARGGFKITEQGAQSARHEGRAKLIASIEKNLPKLSPPDLLLVDIITGDLGLDVQRAETHSDLYWEAAKAYRAWADGAGKDFQQPVKPDCIFGRKYVHLRNEHGLLAKYDIVAGRIVE